MKRLDRSNGNIVVYNNNSMDYKYKKITEYLDVKYETKNNKVLIKILIKKILSNRRSTSRYYLHFRYLQWRGWLVSVPLYMTLIILSKLANVKITWTCHNIWEYKYKSKLMNIIIRNMVYLFSTSVIVMHEDMIEFLPKYRRNKIHVASFGNFKQYFEAQTILNTHFQNIYDDWLCDNGAKGPDLILISTLTDVQELIDQMKNIEKYKVLLILPQYSNIILTSSLMVYNQYVSSEVNTILKTKDIVGLATLTNISVPTSIYMYASYGIPVIGIDVPPINSIIRDNGLGEISDISKSSLEENIFRIKSNYVQYSNASQKFIQKHSWQKSASVHDLIWK